VARGSCLKSEADIAHPSRSLVACRDLMTAASASKMQESNIASHAPMRACLGQHAARGLDHIACRDVAHAAMVVHGADRTVARLARHHGFGLDGRRKAVQRRPEMRAGGAEN